MINVIKLNRQTINRHATFQQMNQPQVKITLPLTPSTIIVKKEIENESIPENIVIKTTIQDQQIDINELLQFVDFDKLVDIKQSKNVNVYELKDLKNLAKKLNIGISNVNKKSLIEKIKDKYKSQFGNELNLISNLKQIKELNLLIITKLFEKHNIITHKNKLLEEIKKILATKHDVINAIIKVLEDQWIIKHLK